MTGLREMLLQEQDRLEKILQKTTERLKDAPQGRLRLSTNKKWTQYYHCVPGGKQSGEYIAKTNEKLISGLAQKDYDKKILKLTERRLSQIRKITGDYDEKEIEKIFLKEHMTRQKLIEPVEPTWEQQLKDWISETYKGKEFQEGTPLILTERGERVRSKSEKILADFFCRKRIPYKYEHPLYLKHFGTVYPDFTFLSKRTRQEIYWEHDGRMDDPIYAQNAVRKIQAYEENDIYPGERLILTFETERTALDMQLIEKLVCRYLTE
ncbi:hypothetical protein [Blautia sp. An46]|uniref:hypothetical protein n=2 Tax=unclassified Blautia TaxID=2648079 RepID=UPI000B388622|nr:hypothetical protein [Blautia sp. An46]OUN91728.1 hypothetical protein B5G00_11710 [Blautia sp. An46]